MLKLKKLYLQNYCGYQDAEFDFTRPDGSIKPISVFFGPNGCGKSTCLNAVDLLGNAQQFMGRDNDLVFRKMTFHPDYDPTLPHFAKHEVEMSIRGVFEADGEEKIVELSSTRGVVANELASWRNIVYIDADHPMNMKKFQLPADRAELFLDIAETVYGYHVSLGKAVATYEENWDGRSDTYEKFSKGDLGGEKYDYFLDLTIDKGDAIVHFKSMSDGERKIATLLRNLCDPVVIDRSDVVMVDNIEMHIYFKRHAKMIDKLVSCFPEKQFIVTTHSGIMIDHIGKTFGEDCLFDVPTIKGQPLLD